MDRLTHKIRVSAETNRKIVESARFGFVQTAVELPDGDWEIPVSAQVYERIQQMKLFPDESEEDVLVRAFAAHSGSVH